MIPGVVGGDAYVIRQAAKLWKKSATEAVKLERKEPMVLNMAMRPVKSAQAPKKRAMSSKANMKRVR